VVHEIIRIGHGPPGPGVRDAESETPRAPKWKASTEVILVSSGTNRCRFATPGLPGPTHENQSFARKSRKPLRTSVAQQQQQPQALAPDGVPRPIFARMADFYIRNCCFGS
jgi:hypothetical protein